MEEYVLTMSAKDIGEAIMMIRIQHIKMHAEPFAKRLGVSEKLLLTTEEGRGPHGLLILKKINKVFHNVEIGINLTLK
jgi:transcriptional regulator with XRE-family HTH domain